MSVTGFGGTKLMAGKTNFCTDISFNVYRGVLNKMDARVGDEGCSYVFLEAFVYRLLLPAVPIRRRGESYVTHIVNTLTQGRWKKSVKAK